MKIANRKITLRAQKMPKQIRLLPCISVYASLYAPKWQNWAIEISFLCWAMGFKCEKHYDTRSAT